MATVRCYRHRGPTLHVNLHPYRPDSRGTKLVNFSIQPNPKLLGQEILLICGAPEIEAQVEVVAAGAFNKGNLSTSTAAKYTSGYRFTAPVGRDVIDLLNLLKEVVTLPEQEDIEVSISLDWYKEPDEDGDLQNTHMGTYINRTKYAPHPDWSGSRSARTSMIDAMARFIMRHPFYAAATLITAPAGHAADGQSFGESFAKDVAAATGKRYVPMVGQGPRAQRKESDNSNLDLTDEFTMTEVIDRETVIVIDDVYRSGATLRGAAVACRRAGAREVLTVTVARTLRK